MQFIKVPGYPRAYFQPSVFEMSFAGIWTPFLWAFGGSSRDHVAH